jgi:ABC-type Fe3+/spermidine/putrescine transport system ATPase subunit
MSAEIHMPVLEVRNLIKLFGSVRAVNDVSFAVGRGEILVIVGGSGCGKTTTLRCIAGLEDLSDGFILLNGRIVSSRKVSVAPEARQIGMVFQSYALWPHMTVAQNVAYGLTRRKTNAAEGMDRVTAILKQVGLSGFEDRFPSTLSGGQQQRVALARSAVLQPKLLLLDEPLSNLDAKMREQMRDELRGMIKMFDMTAVHITHDQEEAMALADRVICMRSGCIEQIGSPREIYRSPANRFVADFIGASSFLEGKIVEISGNDVVVDIDGAFRLHVAQVASPVQGASCTLAIRPEAIDLMAADAGQSNVFAATTLQGTFLGSCSEYLLDICGQRLKAKSAVDIPVGAVCSVRIDPYKIASIAT